MGSDIDLTRLAKLYSAGPAVLYVNAAAAEDGRFVPKFVSPSFETQFGWSLEEVLASPDFWPTNTHPEDRIRVDAVFDRLPATGQASVDYRFQHKDGSYRWVTDSVQFIEADATNPSQAIGYMVDVTRQKEAESALRQSQERYRMVVEQLNEGIGIRDENGRIVYANKAFSEMLGYEPDEFIGTTADDITAESSRLHMRSELQRRKKGVEEPYETALKHKDGKIVHAIHSPRAIFDENGKFRCSFAVVTDITQRKEAEVALRQIMDNMLDGLVVIDDASTILSFNPAAAGMFGYDAEDVIGQDVSILMSPEDADRHEAAVNEYLATDKPRALGSGARNLTGRRKDGTSFPIEIAISEMNTAGKRSFIGVVRDATIRHNAEAALVRAKQSAETASRTKSEFLANVSHELRTPLNAVIGFSDLMMDRKTGDALSPKYQEYVDHIHRSGKHLLDLINDLLDLSKAESGVDEIEEEVLELAPTVTGVVKLLRDQTIRQGTTIDLRMTDTLPLIRGDKRKLTQILLNLLGNAIKFSRPGGRIWITASGSIDRGIALTVSDTGIGMDPENIPRALEPFRQVRHDSTRDALGTGLGLPLVKALTELHGGRLEVRSALGVGTSVCVSLPPERAVVEEIPDDNQSVVQLVVSNG